MEQVHPSSTAVGLVDRMLTIETDLVVTVTAPLDRRRPGNNEDRIRLRNLLADAHKRVLDARAGAAGGALLDGLDRAVADTDLNGAEGFFAVATAEMAEAHTLPFPVREHVALATTPATRYLVQGLRRSPRYRVLVVSDHATRLFEATRDHLVEIEERGFPFQADVVPRDRRAVAGRFALAPGGDDKEQWRKFYREVDGALTEVGRGDVLPIVLAGVKGSTSLFEELSSNAHHVVGHLDGAHDHLSTRDLGAAAWPIMRQRLKERRREARADLVGGVHAGTAVTGLDDAWRYAREGRGRLLVVEEDYRAQPSIEQDGRLVSVGSGGVGSGGSPDGDVMEDPVDELIEHVVRAGGAAEFLATDDLAEHGRIGLMLR